MPSFAKFVGHYFPNFSVIDSMMSLKGLLFTSHRGGSYAPSSTSSSRNGHFHKLGISDHHKGMKQFHGLVGTRDLELGDFAPHTETHVKSGGVVDTERRAGIHVLQGWQQVSQEAENQDSQAVLSPSSREIGNLGGMKQMTR